MYCFNCGKFFPDEDVVQRRDGETALHIYCCPYCGVDDIGESEECSICGKEFPEYETSHGFCLHCLWETIDYDLALEYMKGDDYVQLVEFILNDWFDGSLDGGITNKLGQFMEETFKRLVADEKLRCAMSKQEEPKFLEACRFYCLPYYQSGNFGIEGEGFAEWFAQRKKEGKR